MAYKNILVHVDENGNTATLDAACKIALESEAHLTGIYVTPALDMPTYVENSMPVGFLESQQKSENKSVARAKSLFQKAVRDTGCLSEWIESKGFVDEQIVKQGQYADLIIISQSGSLNSPSTQHTLENRVLLTSPHPVLVIPYTGFKGYIGRRIMLAWNDTMEAARAASDAMPLLQAANIVNVVNVINSLDNNEVPTADMCVYLARHGVTAEANTALAGELSTSTVLLNHASDRGIDLIVMGAYGHTRLREWMLGGSTYDMLKHMTVPVLMSH